MRRAGLVLLVLLASATTAAAHSSIVATSPDSGALLRSAPRAITVIYAEPLGEASSARVIVAGADVAGVPRLDAANRRRLVIPLADAAPGRHRASWVVVGADGHSLAGETSFTVRASPLVIALRRVARWLKIAVGRLDAARAVPEDAAAR